jgi:hypothetical protein
MQTMTELRMIVSRCGYTFLKNEIGQYGLWWAYARCDEKPSLTVYCSGTSKKQALKNLVHDLSRK